jgi:uncharacterized protein YyaL (SSP411 family)
MPMAHAFVMTALDFILGPTFEVVVSGKPGAADTRRMLAALDRPYVPNKVMVLRPSDDPHDLVELVPYAREQAPVGSSATAYICRNFACDLPTNDPAEAAAKLSGAER